MTSALDWYEYKQDMHEISDTDYTLWILAHELDYWQQVAIVFYASYSQQDDWMPF
jgi:ABC-type polar amino acid transport system ATPase subunit